MANMKGGFFDSRKRTSQASALPVSFLCSCATFRTAELGLAKKLWLLVEKRRGVSPLALVTGSDGFAFINDGCERGCNVFPH
jgi:hypothetical protein